MSIDHAGMRPAPRCYAQRPTAKAVVQERCEIDCGAILVMMSSLTAVAVFLVSYRGGIF